MSVACFYLKLVLFLILIKCMLQLDDDAQLAPRVEDASFQFDPSAAAPQDGFKF